jgi:menaquinone-dependent protoporphyrinogen oxidase
MPSIPVFFSTSEGQTRTIAETIAAVLRQEGFDSEAVDLARQQASPQWLNLVSAVIGASVHVGRHQHDASAFAAREACHLNARPSAFFSVSLSAGSRDPAEVDAAHGMAAAFARNAGWRPRRIACFAGKLAYTQYGFFTRLVMRRIAKKEGGPTDISRDHELTDWTVVRAFAQSVAADARAALGVRAAS